MTTSTSKDLIAALQMTLDGRILDADGRSDWVDSWADGLELLPRVDGFVLGGGMFSGYEQFWTAILEDPALVAEMLGREPYPREIAYAEVAAETEHLVLSTTLADVDLAERTNRPFPRGDRHLQARRPGHGLRRRRADVDHEPPRRRLARASSA